jgi:hypothetical protein
MCTYDGRFTSSVFPRCLLLCPAGFSEDSRGYLSVYLELLTSYKPEVWTKFKFEVLDAMGQAAHISGKNT